MRTHHVEQLRRMFTRNQSTKGIFMHTDDEFGYATKPGEQYARAHCTDDCTLCGADRKRNAKRAIAGLAVLIGVVFFVAAGGV